MPLRSSASNDPSPISKAIPYAPKQSTALLASPPLRQIPPASSPSTAPIGPLKTLSTGSVMSPSMKIAARSASFQAPRSWPPCAISPSASYAWPVLKISPKLYALVLGIKTYPCASSAFPALNQLKLSALTPASPSPCDTTRSSFARNAPPCPVPLLVSQRAITPDRTITPRALILLPPVLSLVRLCRDRVGLETSDINNRHMCGMIEFNAVEMEHKQRRARTDVPKTLIGPQEKAQRG